MGRIRGSWAVVLAAGLLAGCVERRYVVNSDPPGAAVLRNGRPLGAAPADDHFLYYGNYHFTLVKDGYQTRQVDELIKAPWYEYAPLDFFAENLIPWTITDRREFTYQMQPLQLPNTKDLLNEAETLRQRGQSLTPPSDAVPPTP